MVDKDYIGTHIAMDIVTKDRDLFRNEGMAKIYLKEMIKLGKMTCLRHPETFTFPYANEYTNFLEALKEEGTHSPVIDNAQNLYNYNQTEGSGVTGFSILCESHVALHSFPEKEKPFMSVCFYSCKEYDEKSIIEYTKKFWKAENINIVLMDRFIGKPQKVRQWSE